MPQQKSGTLRLFEDSLDTEPTHETEVSDLPGGSMQVISIDQAREGDTVYYLQLDAEDEDESNNLYILAYDDSIPALDADLSGSGLLTVTVNTEKVDISNTSVVVAVKEADGRFERAFVKPLAECGQRDNIAGLTLSLTDLPTGGKVQVLAVDQTTWAPVTEGLWV